MRKEKNRQLAAIMFTDIVGYTALMQKDEAAAGEVRAYHRSRFEHFHRIHQGKIIQYFGDGTLSIFQSAINAVECAIAIQRSMQEEKGVPLRIGLHVGDIVLDGSEVYGDGVNLAARIESMGVGGAILVSARLNEDLKNQPHIQTISMGRFHMKNVEEPVEVFAVDAEGIHLPKVEELDGKGKREDKSIAVLPFRNMSADQELEYFSDGMTEEIINALTRVEKLKVTSRTSSFYFKDRDIPVRQIGEELMVSTILEGSVRLSGSKMRITAQLIDVADDFHFWSETYDRPVDDVFAVQDEISLKIADKLREHLGHLEIQDHLVDAPSVPVDVYREYLKSRYHILKMTKPEIKLGIAILDKVIARQPDYAYAHLGMNMAYTLLGTLGLMPVMEAFGKGHEYLQKAIEIDPNLPECQLQLSWKSFLQDWDMEAAYTHLAQVRAIRPIVDYFQTMTSILVAEGRFDAAMHYIDTAFRMDPFSEINHHLKGYIFYCQESWEEAIPHFNKSIELKPDGQVSVLYRGQALLLMGREVEALDYFTGLPEDPSGDLVKLGGITMAQIALGRLDEAGKGMEILEKALDSDIMGRATNLLILCHTMLGNDDQALDLLQQGLDNHLPMMAYLYVEPMLNPIRSLPRFRKMMQVIFREKVPLDDQRRKYASEIFTQEELTTLQIRLNDLMEREKPYLNPELSLRGLAASMDLTPNQMSRLLNEGFEQNFSEYINSLRLNAFMETAKDPSKRHLSILGMAYESGFNSKTVFNTFFRKETGMTPSAWLKEVAGE